MRIIEHVVDILADQAPVWQVLTETERYGEWNPFIRRLSGRLAVGGRVTVTFHPGRRPMMFRPTVIAVDEGRLIRWRRRLGVPGVLDGDHSMRLEATSGGTRFVQRRPSGACTCRSGAGSSTTGGGPASPPWPSRSGAGPSLEHEDGRRHDRADHDGDDARSTPHGRGAGRRRASRLQHRRRTPAPHAHGRSGAARARTSSSTIPPQADAGWSVQPAPARVPGRGGGGGGSAAVPSGLACDRPQRTVSARVRALKMINANEEVCMNDGRREVTRAGRRTIEMTPCPVTAPAGSSGLVAGT